MGITSSRVRGLGSDPVAVAVGRSCICRSAACTSKAPLVAKPICVRESHPGSIPVALAPEGFLVSEPGQPSQMTPVGAGPVAPVSVGQLPGDRGGQGRLQAASTDLNPSLEMTRAGLEHHARLMPVDSHSFERGGIGVVQIQQDIAGVPVFSIGLNVYVTALAIANAQESHRRFLAQLGGGPEPFTRECPSGGVVNQSHQIEIVRHRRELPPDGVQREEQTTIKHKHNCLRSNSPYNALMLYPRGRREKSNVGNGRCQNSGLSQKRAQDTPDKFGLKTRQIATGTCSKCRSGTDCSNTLLIAPECSCPVAGLGGFLPDGA